MNQITIALNGASHLLAEVRSTVEWVLNGLHGEVRVTTVDNFKNMCTLPFGIFRRPLTSRDWTIT
jgi:hypothetical protein